jgi:hypothetical protein
MLYWSDKRRALDARLKKPLVRRGERRNKKPVPAEAGFHLGSPD